MVLRVGERREEGKNGGEEETLGPENGGMRCGPDYGPLVTWKRGPPHRKGVSCSWQTLKRSKELEITGRWMALRNLNTFLNRLPAVAAAAVARYLLPQPTNSRLPRWHYVRRTSKRYRDTFVKGLHSYPWATDSIKTLRLSWIGIHFFISMHSRTISGQRSWSRSDLMDSELQSIWYANK